jgi:hypothetical protein
MKESRRQKEHPADHKERGPFRLLRFAHGERECRYGLPIVRPRSKYGHTLARFLSLQSLNAERRDSGFSALFALQVLTGMPPPEKQTCYFTEMDLFAV